MPAIYNPGTTQAAGDAFPWVLKDGYEGPLTAIIIVGVLVLWYWYQQRLNERKTGENEQNL